MIYDLPETVEVDGEEYPIRSDYRAILDIIQAVNDVELDDQARLYVLLSIFYEDKIPQDIEGAVQACFRFIDGGNEPRPGKRRQPKLMDWQQDFPFIVAPINKALGKDVRSVPMHWWTFLGYYYEIGESTFSQIVAIRKKRKTGEKLTKSEREYYRNNMDIIEFRTTYSEAETELLKQWGGGGRAQQ